MREIVQHPPHYSCLVAQCLPEDRRKRVTKWLPDYFHQESVQRAPRNSPAVHQIDEHEAGVFILAELLNKTGEYGNTFLEPTMMNSEARLRIQIWREVSRF